MHTDILRIFSVGIFTPIFLEYSGWNIQSILGIFSVFSADICTPIFLEYLAQIYARRYSWNIQCRYVLSIPLTLTHTENFQKILCTFSLSRALVQIRKLQRQIFEFVLSVLAGCRKFFSKFSGRSK